MKVLFFTIKSSELQTISIIPGTSMKAVKHLRHAAMRKFTVSYTPSLSEWDCPKELLCVPCPSRLARLQAPPSLSFLSSQFLSSACDERISCEDDFRAGMEERVLFEGENRIAAQRKKESASEGKERRERNKKREEIIGGGRERDYYPNWSNVHTQWKSKISKVITVLKCTMTSAQVSPKPALFCLPSWAWN